MYQRKESGQGLVGRSLKSPGWPDLDRELEDSWLVASVCRLLEFIVRTKQRRLLRVVLTDRWDGSTLGAAILVATTDTVATSIVQRMAVGR